MILYNTELQLGEYYQMKHDSLGQYFESFLSVVYKLSLSAVETAVIVAAKRGLEAAGSYY